MALLSDLTGYPGTQAKETPLASKAGPGTVDPYQPGDGIFYGTTYTPDLTPGQNVTAAKLKALKVLFTRSGPNVLCTGTVQVGSTQGAGKTTSFFMSLPVPSDLGYTIDLAGSGTRAGAAGLLTEATFSPVMISGDATGNRAEFVFNSNTVNVTNITFVFQYGII